MTGQCGRMIFIIIPATPGNGKRGGKKEGLLWRECLLDTRWTT